MINTHNWFPILRWVTYSTVRSRQKLTNNYTSYVNEFKSARGMDATAACLTLTDPLRIKPWSQDRWNHGMRLFSKWYSFVKTSSLVFYFLLDQREKVKKRKDDPTVAPTAFLWAAYYPNRYYYEVRHRPLQLLFRGITLILRT